MQYLLVQPEVPAVIRVLLVGGEFLLHGFPECGVVRDGGVGCLVFIGYFSGSLETEEMGIPY